VIVTKNLRGMGTVYDSPEASVSIAGRAMTSQYERARLVRTWSTFAAFIRHDRSRLPHSRDECIPILSRCCRGHVAQGLLEHCTIILSLMDLSDHLHWRGCRLIMRRQEEHKNLLRPLNCWRMAAIALALVMPMLTAFTDSAYATRRSSVYPTKHHASTGPHVAKSRVVKQRKRLRSALMPPAPRDFGPHFDFPPASLNDGPTQAPYPGW
jgi:hypothetical protein